MTNAMPAVPGAVHLRSIPEYVVELLEEITADWDRGPMSPATELGSLGIESINLVYLLAEVQQEFALGDRLLGTLRAERIDIRTLRVGELCELAARTARAPQEAGP
jgi:hypothetical protein